MTINSKTWETSRMDATDGLMRRFERYAKDTFVPASHADVRLACQAVLRTVQSGIRGDCNFVTARNVIRLADAVAFYRSREVAEANERHETHRQCLGAMDWKLVLMRAVKHQRPGVDDPQELRRNILREIEAGNLLRPDQDQLRPADLEV